jgi:hypothetical protein
MTAAYRGMMANRTSPGLRIESLLIRKSKWPIRRNPSGSIVTATTTKPRRSRR